MDGDEALRWLVELAEALDAAETELSQLGEMTDVPLPDDLLKQLAERDAMKATLKRLIETSANPQRMRERAAEIYREEFAHAGRTDDAPAMPVQEDVMAMLVDVREALRRRALTDGDLAAALDGALLRAALAGV